MKEPQQPGRFEILILFCIVLPCFAFFISCAGKKLSPDDARRLIAEELQIPEGDVEVSATSEMGGSVVADASIRFAVLLQKDANGKWKLIRVRRSDDNWLSPEAFRQSLPAPFSEALATAFLNEVNRDPQ